MFRFLIFFFSATLYSYEISLQTIPQKAKVGEQFTIELKTDLPAEAKLPFLMHLRFLSASRPLPGPFALEKVSMEKDRVILQARIISPGEHTIELGRFVWRGLNLLLPQISIHVEPLNLPVLSYADLIPPFPNKIVRVSSANIGLQSTLISQNIQKGLLKLRFQHFLYAFTSLSIVALVFSPLLVQLYYERKERKPRVKHVEISLEERLKRLHRMREKLPWTEMLRLLNQIDHQTLTAHELRDRFASQGKQELSHVANLIEQYAYRQGTYEQKFQDALSSLKIK